MRLIDADALKKAFCDWCDSSDSANSDIVCGKSCATLDLFDSMPTIEPEVRHGRWIFQKGDNKETVDGWICTSCKSGFHTKVPYFEAFKYCPMCGARMDGGVDNG